MNKKKWITPFISLIIVCMIGTLLIFPIINMQPKDITIGVLSLDEGTELTQGYVNLGDKLTSSITEATENSDYASAVTWKIYKHENKLRNDIEKGILHGAIIVPEDFTAVQTASVTSLNALNEGITKLADGMSKVDAGAGAFASGTSQLPSSLENMSAATSAIDSGLIKLEYSIGSEETHNTLLFASGSVADGAASIHSAINSKLKPAASGLSAGLSSADGYLKLVQENLAAGNVAEAQRNLYAALLILEGAENQPGLVAVSGQLSSGINELSTAAGTLSDGTAKLNDGIGAVKTAVSALQDGSAKLDTGVGTFADKAGTLTSGATKLSDATGQLNDGMSTLSENVTSMVDGIADQITGDAEPAETADAPVEILINQGVNVTVSSVLDSMITKVFAEAGLDFQTEYVNPVDAGFSAAYFGSCIFIFVYLISYVSGVVLTRSHPLKGTCGKEKSKYAMIQLLYVLALSICAGLLITGIISVINPMELPASDMIIFLSIASFALILLVAGSIDLFGLAGMAIPILMLVLGMGTANMPYEFLPEFWQNFIYPWMPLQIISNGIKQVVYTDAGWWNSMTADLMIVIAIGFALLLISAVRPAKKEATT